MPVITWPKSDTVEEALIQGELRETAGCLFIDAGEGGFGVAVFSYGTTWDAPTSAVVNPDGSSLTVGQTVTASGGGHQVAELDEWLPPDTVRLIRECGDAGATNRAFILGHLQASS